MKLQRRKPPARRRGLALIEVLICSSISAMLLTATAVAFRSSVMAYRDNNDRNIMVSEGRIAMRQIIQEIRQADSHGAINDTAVPNATSLFKAGTVVENSGLWLIKSQADSDDPSIVSSNPSTWVTITYQYDPGNFRITRTRQVGGGTATTSVACVFVQDFKVRLEPGRSAAHVSSGNPDYDMLNRAVVSLTMQNVDATGKMQWAQGNGQVVTRIIDSAVPRKFFAGS
ncbi:MAG TPA: hypothetical protein VHM90_20665 [Phycisphaerae bacterium]|nr:hypothetical protein [Phycisphaerae bacterium]